MTSTVLDPRDVSQGPLAPLPVLRARRPRSSQKAAMPSRSVEWSRIIEGSQRGGSRDERLTDVLLYDALYQ